MASRSLCLPPARTHFWIVAARGGSNGTGSSPRKYGTNCIIPELVNIGAVGCVGIRLADGTTVWSRAAKNSVQTWRSPLASMTRRAYRWVRGRPSASDRPTVGRGARASRSRIASRPLGHRGAALGAAGPEAPVTVGRHPLGHVAVDGLPDEALDPERGCRSPTPTPMPIQNIRLNTVSASRCRRKALAARPVPEARATVLMTGVEKAR